MDVGILLFSRLKNSSNWGENINTVTGGLDSCILASTFRLTLLQMQLEFHSAQLKSIEFSLLFEVNDLHFEQKNLIGKIVTLLGGN